MGDSGVVLTPYPPAKHLVNSLTSRIDIHRLKATVAHLSSWPNRNTNNLGLVEACAWAKSEFEKIPGLEVHEFRYRIHKGPRVAADKEIPEVVAVLAGETDRRIVIGGHIDSINMVEQGFDGRAPGANDDGSGVALTLELARVMSTRRWRNTLVFVAFSGEEQGLLGSTALAQEAKATQWKIDAVISNDMVGNSQDLSGRRDQRVRIFSEDSLMHQSRELARYAAWLADPSGRKRNGGGVELVLRADRFGRGGDHTPFNREGFTAIRIVDAVEEYKRQHTPLDLPEAMDFRHLRNVARFNLDLAASLAEAGPPPTDVKVDRRQGHDTHLTWNVTPGTSYVLYSRLTTSAYWTMAQDLGAVSEVTAPIDKDNSVFAVGAMGGIPVEAC